MKQTQAMDKLDQFIIAASKASAKKKTSKRKNIVARTKTRIMREKHDKKTNAVISGTMRRHHMTIYIHNHLCQSCGYEYASIGQIEVWDKSNSESDTLSSTRLNCLVKGKGMFDFHNDLPKVIHHQNVYDPICVKCYESYS